MKAGPKKKPRSAAGRPMAEMLDGAAPDRAELARFARLARGYPMEKRADVVWLRYALGRMLERMDRDPFSLSRRGGR